MGGRQIPYSGTSPISELRLWFYRPISPCEFLIPTFPRPTSSELLTFAVHQGFADQTSVRLFSTFLICASAQGGIPTCMAYQSNNIRGQWKRAFTSASMIGAGGIGGIAGSLVFRTQDSPHYRPGVYACLACNAVMAVSVAILSWYFRRENRRADRGEKILEGVSSCFCEIIVSELTLLVNRIRTLGIPSDRVFAAHGWK